jgi:hypothetical protein
MAITIDDLKQLQNKAEIVAALGFEDESTCLEALEAFLDEFIAEDKHLSRNADLLVGGQRKKYGVVTWRSVDIKLLCVAVRECEWRDEDIAIALNRLHPRSVQLKPDTVKRKRDKLKAEGLRGLRRTRPEKNLANAGDIQHGPGLRTVREGDHSDKKIPVKSNRGADFGVEQ